jgi:hypothetical protein
VGSRLAAQAAELDLVELEVAESVATGRVAELEAVESAE